ncbi:Hypothetical predicted protein [Cloeon dipterum]|uniref:Uncharacterized protein n=1 Tax=Cloeon dipterum TaxID=197152 RepID=A0A8S1CES0_9INSE|nr:Hypothetical predicted protein [Cloeon dipterum]
MFNRGSNIFTFLHCGRLFRQQQKEVHCSCVYPNLADSTKKKKQKIKPPHHMLFKFSCNFKCKDLVIWSPDSPSSTENLIRLGEKHSTSMLYLENSKFLVRRCCLSGQTKDIIFLSNTLKFNEMTSDSESDLIALKSTRLKGPTNRDLDAVFTIAVFSSPPLRFVAMFEVKSSIFGKKIQDVGVGQGLVFIRYYDDRVALFSLVSILNNCIVTKVEDMDKNERWKIGREPFGLPMNAVISESLPSLFEVQSYQGELVIGANPWHYITKTSINQLQIHNLNTMKTVTEVEFSRHFAGMEVEHLFFHPDDTRKAIHVCNNKLRVYLIKDDGLKTLLLHEEEMPKWYSSLRSTNDTTRSGRTVRKSLAAREALESQILEEENTLTHDLSISLDSESNILAIFAIIAKGPEQIRMLHIALYDNSTGKLLRKIPLEMAYSSSLFNVTCNLTLDGVNILAEVRDKSFMNGCLLNLVEIF